MKKILMTAGMLLLSLALVACGNTGQSKSTDEITIGYFPNINHVAGMVAEEKKMYEETLPDGTKVNYKYFPDGSAFMTAIETGEIQGGLVGPGPAMNHFTSGAKINVVAAGSTGGTVIMARKGAGIDSVEDIKGKTFISPRVGCTHDVQFETLMMREFGMKSDRLDGSLKHVTGKPATYAQQFAQGQVDIATVPEPWASKIEEDGYGKVLIDTKNVAFGETLPAAVFVTSSDLVKNNKDLVQNIVDAHKEATEFIQNNPEEAKQIAIKKIKDITNQELSKSVIDNAWNRIDFTYQVKESTLQAFANASHELKFLKEQPDLSGLVDRSFIEE
ncbi:aliphatic sulfonate ABC transporter substrate-binding protein [Pontibacillus sp. HMF3514]|uniref:aliphatic sulfonate ABC transporter substrate-binding protein n=1 Tax=Pontibacillus sp. HMF3514 TaxID=2692425 RepID=UPI00131F7C5C|nr:aliphatic sulfonate ABC transporter substrate-binding protein [Pontibacillus sp. HMF3514]QHE51506.1 aliphatic sulfonate ABC transporter substrate-binding protein [Pontibacillus sp. HMF3514]